MQILPHDAIESLEFQKIKELLTKYTNVPLVKDFILALQASANSDKIKKELQQTSEYLQLLNDGEIFPITHFKSLQSAIKNLENPYGILTSEDCVEIRNQATTINAIILFLEERASAYKELYDIVYLISPQSQLIKTIDHIFDKNGVIKNSASKKLTEIRKELEKIRKEVNRRFERAASKAKKDGHLRDFEETYYYGRRVLAVTSEYKRVVKGKILGTSESQSTTFIEPYSNVLLNEEIDDLLDEEKREIFKILKELTTNIRQHSHEVIVNQDVLLWFEFTRAKAHFAQKLKAVLPGISNDKSVNLKNALHPLLFLLNSEANKATIPLNLHFNQENRMIVISGPNAGGKSISLKTVGLLQLMLQSGMLLPVHHDSNLRIYDTVLVELGDTQSIEYELSTYSSKLEKMKLFLKKANENSLVLMDEFGTGSDPDLGGVIAEVVLEKLSDLGAQGVVTTHYNNIKLRAETYPGLVNASMLFDTKTFQPKYELVMGQAGSSYTFEVATSVGLQKEIIAEAKRRTQSQKLDYDKILTTYQSKVAALEKEADTLKNKEKEFEMLSALTTARQDELNARLKDDKSEAVERNQLQMRGKFLDELLRDFEKHKSKKLLLEKLLKKYNAEKIKLLEEKKSALLKEKRVQSIKKRKYNKKQAAILPKVGDKVRMKNGGKQTGVIQQIEKEKAHVTFGFIKSIVDIKQLIVV